MRLTHFVTLGAVLLAMSAAAHGQMTINGEADDPLYGGAPLNLTGGWPAVQDTNTGFGNNHNSAPDWAGGSELDVAYGVIFDGYLYLVLAGNLETNGNQLELFFDTRSGGQNQLMGPENPDIDYGALQRMGNDPNDPNANGLKFSAGFDADFYVTLNTLQDPNGLTSVYVDCAELYDVINAPIPDSFYAGAGLTRCETNGGALLGADPNDPVFFCTIDNSNILGVDGTLGIGSGSGVTTGVEIAIPLEALDNPTGEIFVVAFINSGSHNFVSNQFLGGFFGNPPNADANGNPGEPRVIDLAPTFHTPIVVPVAPTPTGACCDGATCSITTEAGCTGTYLGHNTQCYGDAPCDGTPIGACCLIDDTNDRQYCQLTSSTECDTLGGTFDPNETCESCPCPIYGACCLSDTECEFASEDDCIALAGDYVGDYTRCNDEPCATGACCLPDPNDPVNDMCLEMRAHTCADNEGRFLGVGTDCVGNPCAFIIDTPYVAGSFQDWDPGASPMLESPPDSGIWIATFTDLTPLNREEFKITNGTWDHYFPGPNSWLFTDPNGAITISYDTNQYDDGWAPDIARLGLSYDIGTWTAVGNHQDKLPGHGSAPDWDNDDPNAVMLSDPNVPGVYVYEETGFGVGDYEWKAVVTGSWDSISWDARSVNTANTAFTVLTEADVVRLSVNGLVGTIKTEVISAVCRGDCNCDGQIDFGDINPFVAALGVPPVYCDDGSNADIDGNGSPGFEDINPFVALLTSYPLPIECPGPLK